MGDKNLSILFVDDLREWFFKKEFRDCINWRRGFSYTFPDLHMNNQTRSNGSSICIFNAVGFPKKKGTGKKIYITYITSVI